MDTETASQFVSSLVQSIQALCHGYVNFSSSVEVVGHIYLKVDSGSKFNYIVNEEVSKKSDGLSTVFHTNSYQSLPGCCKCKQNPENRQSVIDSVVKNTNINNPVKENRVNVKLANMGSVPIPHQLNAHARTRDDGGQIQNQEPEYLAPQESHDDNFPSTSSPVYTKSKSTSSSRRKSKKSNQISVLPNSEWIQVQPDIDPVVAIKHEPATSPSQNAFSENENDINGEKHSVEERPEVEDDKYEDESDREVEGGVPFPVSLHSQMDESVVHLDYMNTALGNQEPSGSNASTSFTKDLTDELRQQIVEFANIVGNRPAARQFGVHESSIRLWRKKFGLPDLPFIPGNKRKRRRFIMSEKMDPGDGAD